MTTVVTFGVSPATMVTFLNEELRKYGLEYHVDGNNHACIQTMPAVSPSDTFFGLLKDLIVGSGEAPCKVARVDFPSRSNSAELRITMLALSYREKITAVADLYLEKFGTQGAAVRIDV